MTKKSTPQADQNFGDHFQHKMLLCVEAILGMGGPTRLGFVLVFIYVTKPLEVTQLTVDGELSPTQSTFLKSKNYTMLSWDTPYRFFNVPFPIGERPT